jgi:hypothetical protein
MEGIMKKVILILLATTLLFSSSSVYANSQSKVIEMCASAEKNINLLLEIKSIECLPGKGTIPGTYSWEG